MKERAELERLREMYGMVRGAGEKAQTLEEIRAELARLRELFDMQKEARRMTDGTKTSLRKEIDELQIQVAGLCLVTEALCEDLWNIAGAWPPKMAIAIPYGDPHPLQDFAGKWHLQHNTRVAKAMAEEGHGIAKAVDQEVARLKGLFDNRCKPKPAPF